MKHLLTGLVIWFLMIVSPVAAQNKKVTNIFYAQNTLNGFTNAPRTALEKARLVYPHINNYCETVAHAVKLAKMVNRKNYGASLNLCHLLKVEGSGGIDDKLREFTPFLFAVNICGADDGDTRQMGWDRLIQPLGQGSFDTYHFVKVLLDNGFNGPIGLQCYNLKGDVVTTLTNSLQTWNEYKKRYLEEKK